VLGLQVCLSFFYDELAAVLEDGVANPFFSSWLCEQTQKPFHVHYLSDVGSLHEPAALDLDDLHLFCDRFTRAHVWCVSADLVG
jgi:hypothetical protein